jgi:hypothetical protein
MRDHYQVKFTLGDKTIYGVVEDADDAERPAGIVLVRDAILPKYYEVRETDLTDIPLSGDEYVNFVDGERQKAWDASDKIVGLAPGKVLSVPIGDGSAWYVITRVSRGKCHIEWRGFSFDRWTDRVFGWGGAFPKAALERFADY